MMETALRDTSGHIQEHIEAVKKYYLCYYDADASNLEGEALDSVERDQENFKALFFGIWVLYKKNEMYYRALMKVLENPPITIPTDLSRKSILTSYLRLR